MQKSKIIRTALLSTLILAFGALSAQAAEACCPMLLANEASPAAIAAYPLKTCVVSGESLTDGDMGGPVDYIHKEAGKPDILVRFCCKSCIKKFQKDPAKYLAKLDAAATSPTAPTADASHKH